MTKIPFGRPVIAAVALVTALWVGGVRPASAYTYQGYYFAGMLSPGITYCNNAGDSGSITAFNNAVSSWSNDGYADAWFTSSCSNPQEELISGDQGNVGWDGETVYYSTLQHTCNGWTEEFATDSELNTYYTSGYSSGERQSVAGHELGHVLGLGHSTAYAIMIADTPTRWGTDGIDTPQTDDNNGVNAIYSKCGA